MKKMLIGLGAVATATVPVIAVVSCGGSSSGEIKKQDTKPNSQLGSYAIVPEMVENQIDFADLKIDKASQGGVMFGPAAYGLSMGGSYIINLAEQLGFNTSDKDQAGNSEKANTLRQAIAAIQPIPDAGSILIKPGERRNIDMGSQGSIVLNPTDLSSATTTDANGEKHITGWAADNFTVIGYNIPTSWVKSGDGNFTFNNEKFRIGDYTNWIDAKKPGFTKIEFSVDGMNFTKTLESQTRVYPEFAKAQGDLRNEVITSTIATLKNFKNLFNGRTELKDKTIRDYAGDLLLDSIQFLSEGTFTNDQIAHAFDAINTGAIDMYGLQMVLRGVKNVPAKLSPAVNPFIAFALKQDTTNDKNEVVLKGEFQENGMPGMTSIKRGLELAYWFYDMPSKDEDKQARIDQKLSPATNGDLWLAATQD